MMMRSQVCVVKNLKSVLDIRRGLLVACHAFTRVEAGTRPAESHQVSNVPRLVTAD